MVYGALFEYPLCHIFVWNGVEMVIVFEEVLKK